VELDFLRGFEGGVGGTAGEETVEVLGEGEWQEENEDRQEPREEERAWWCTSEHLQGRPLVAVASWGPFGVVARLPPGVGEGGQERGAGAVWVRASPRKERRVLGGVLGAARREDRAKADRREAKSAVPRAEDILSEFLID